MPQIQSRQFENFGDGLLTVCEADERTITRTKMEHIRFGNRTVGVQRFWQAKTAGNKVDKLLAVPLSVLEIDLIEVNDVVILENEIVIGEKSGQYQILQIQPKYDKKPPVLYLSLEKLVHPYKDGRDAGGG